MSRNVDIDYILKSLKNIGYEISSHQEHYNNGVFWDISFSNSKAKVSIYDSIKKANTTIKGNCSEIEKENLKYIIEGLKYQIIQISELNKNIVDLINTKKEDYYYDFKIKLGNRGSLLHDILCLANNTRNRESYLIFGVDDNADVVGGDCFEESNKFYNWITSIKFASGVIPDIEIKDIYYKYIKIKVLVIKKSNNIPFYLIEDYRKNESMVMAYRIYTRIGDTNTPIDKHANFSDVEKLWRLRFNLEDEINN